MVSPIILQDQSGLAQGISQAGGALAQALQQRGKQKLQEEQTQQLAAQFPENTTLGKLLRSPGGIDTVQKLAPILGPMVKSQTEQEGMQSLIEKWTPKDQLEPPLTQQEKPLIPIEEVKSFQEKQTQKGVQETASKIVETPQGVYEKKEMINTPFGQFHPEQIRDYELSPYPRFQKIAQDVKKFITDQENLRGQEGIQIRKENRQQINEYKKPYLNVKNTQKLLSGFQEAKNIIKSGKVSLDDNWMRNAAIAVLEDKDATQVAELIKTPEQRRLYSLIYNSLRTKDVGGSNPSTREVLLSLAAKPSVLKGDKENLSILNDLILETEDSLYKGKAMLDLEDQGGYKSFPRYVSEINDIVDPKLKARRQELTNNDNVYLLKKEFSNKGTVNNKPVPTGTFAMYFPDGKVRTIPKNKVKQAQKTGAKLINGK